MLARKLWRAPAVVVASVPGVIALALLCEAPRVILGRTDVQIVGMAVVAFKQIAVDLRLDLIARPSACLPAPSLSLNEQTRCSVQ